MAVQRGWVCAVALCCAAGCGDSDSASDGADAGDSRDAATADAGDPGPGEPEVTPVELPGGAPGIGFDDLQWSAELGRVIVPGGRSGNLYLIDPDSLEVTAIDGFSAGDTYAGGHDFGTTSAVSASGLLYAIDRETTELVQVDPATGGRLAALTLAASPDYVRFVAATNELWVTEPGSGSFEIVALGDEDPPVMTSVDRLAIAGGPESLVIDADGATAYTNSFTGTTYRVDAAARALGTMFDNGCSLSLGIAFDSTAERVFVGCSIGEVGAFSGADGSEQGRLETGGGVDIIAYDSLQQRVFVASGEGARLDVLSVGADGALALEHSVPTAAESRCVTADGKGRAWVCDPVGGRVLRVTLPRP